MYRILRYVIAILFGIMGFMLMEASMPILSPIIDVKFLKMGFFGVSLMKILALILGTGLGGVVGYLISAFVLDQGIRMSKHVERVLSHVPSQE